MAGQATLVEWRTMQVDSELDEIVLACMAAGVPYSRIYATAYSVPMGRTQRHFVYRVWFT